MSELDSAAAAVMGAAIEETVFILDRKIEQLQELILDLKSTRDRLNKSRENY